MHPLSLAPLLMAGVVCYVGIFHLVLFLRRREDRANLSFGLTCLSVALYDVFCSGLYASTSIEAALPWQRGQIVLITLFGAFFLHFVSDYTGRVHPIVLRGWTVYATVTAGLAAFWSSPLLLDGSRPLTKLFDLPFGLGRLVVHEASAGPLLEGVSALTLLYLLYLVHVLRLDWLGRLARPRLPLQLAVLLLGLATLNDMFVAAGLLASFYLFEYAYLGMVLLMAQGLTASLVEATRTKRILRATERNLATILHHAPTEIFLKDLDGRYLLVSPNLAKNAGLEPSAMIGRKDEELFSPEVAAVYRAHDLAVLEGEEALSFEESNVLPDEERSFLVLKFPVRDEEGRIVATGGVGTDISERNRLEAEMVETQKLESLGLLAGGIAHDFNNLLVAMRAHADLAWTELHGDHPARRHLERVRTAAERAAELTHQLLVYAGKEKVPPREVDLNGLVEELGGLLAVSLSKGTRLHVELAPGLPPVIGDRARLHQVLLNLVTNAADAIATTGGDIHLRTGPDALPEEGDATSAARGEGRSFPAIRIEVEDTGPGMDEETRRRIFEPFFTTKDTGRGLGLAAVQGIVRSHGGLINVDTAPGSGCRFRVVLPAAESGGPPAPSRDVPSDDGPGTPPGTGKTRILVIDDEETVREVSQAILERHGYDVLLAASGADGLRLLEENPSSVSLVLLDLTMPRMDGLQTLERLRRISEDLPVVLFSGFSEREATPALRAGRVSAFLAKPFDVDELVEVVRRCLAEAEPR